MKACVWCGEVFQPHNAAHMFCSKNCWQQRKRWKEGQPWGPPSPWTPSEFWTCNGCGETKPNTPDYWSRNGTTNGSGRKSADGKDELKSPCKVCIAQNARERQKEQVGVPCPCDCGCGNDKSWHLSVCEHCHQMKKKYNECREGYDLKPDEPHWFYIKVSEDLQLMKPGRGDVDRLRRGTRHGFEVKYKVLLTRKQTHEVEKAALDFLGGKHPEGIENLDGFTEMRELDHDQVEALIDFVSNML